MLPQYRVEITGGVAMDPENKQDAASLASRKAAVGHCPVESTELWKARNHEAIAAYNRQVAEEGVFSDGLRTF